MIWDVSGLVSSMSIMKEAVCSMGIPDHIVQLAIDIQRQEHQEDFTAVTQLFLAADEIFSSPEKKHVFEGRCQETETTENAKEQQTDKITVKAEEDNNCISEAHASHVAEMQKVAEAKPVTTDKCKLQEKVKKLARENQRLKQRKFCRACKEVELATSGVTFLPCGHFITCETCSEKFDDCPACGKSIMGTVRTFLS